MSDAGSEYDKYGKLLQHFIQGDLSAEAFQLLYLDEFKHENRRLSDPLFELLDRLFGDVDAFCGDPKVLKELEACQPGFYLDESELRRRVVNAAEALRVLERKARAGASETNGSGGDHD